MIASPTPTEPILVDFPLRGEWVAFHTPAERVPSHGTDQLAQRYAYDFLRIDHAAEGFKFHKASSLRYHVLGSPLRDCYGWGGPIHAPFAGTVVTARDGWPERDPVHFVRDLAMVIKHAFTFDPKKKNGLISVLGNHLVLKQHGTEVHAFIAHARNGSLRVKDGQVVEAGQLVAEVGHSGNSTAPHLHFHLMDGPDILTANALPCAFTDYEALSDGEWHKVDTGMPGKRELVRRKG